MAFTEIYVDPSIAADSGAGTVGDPYGDLEYAIEQTTHDTTNGTRVNIKAGTDEVLAADLTTALADTSVSVAWVGNKASPIIFRGYATTAGDGPQAVGAKAGISGGGSVSILGSATLDYIHFDNLHLHNTGSSVILQMDDYCSITNCEIDNTSGAGVTLGSYCSFVGNYVTNCVTHGVSVSTGGYVAHNVLVNHATNKFVDAIVLATTGTAERNIIDIDSTSNGISALAYARVISNSVYSNGGTGWGIEISTSNMTGFVVLNNLVEGFSGAGGTGFRGNFTNTQILVYGGNAAYNNTTNYDMASARIVVNLGDNETLSASPFTDAPNQDFSPVDTGNVKEGSLPANFGGGVI